MLVKGRTFCVQAWEGWVLPSVAFSSLKNGLGGSPAAAAPSGNVGNDQHCYTSPCVMWRLQIVWFELYAPVRSSKHKSRPPATPPDVRWDSVCHASWINWCKTRLAGCRRVRSSKGAPVCVSAAYWYRATGNEVSWASDLPQEMHHVTLEVRDVDVVMVFRHFIPKRSLSVNPCFHRADAALTPPSLCFCPRSDL